MAVLLFCTPGSVLRADASSSMDDHLSGTRITTRLKRGGVLGATEPSQISDYPNPPCTTMSLPLMNSREVHDSRYSETFHSPMKGLVSVALVLHHLYELWMVRRALPAWRSGSARTFLPQRSQRRSRGDHQKSSDAHSGLEER